MGGTLLRIEIPPFSKCQICSINAISEHPEEKEWLLGPSVFKVLGITRDPHITVIRLQFWRSVFFSWLGEMGT